MPYGRRRGRTTNGLQWVDFARCKVTWSLKLSFAVLGKAEGTEKLWHGHVTAVTVAPEYRRLGLAATLMNILEDVSTNIYDAYFVDLFVRKSNKIAIAMYEKFGYVVYRRVLNYYTGSALTRDEDAFDMRKALPRDKDKESMIPMTRPIRPDELEWW